MKNFSGILIGLFLFFTLALPKAGTKIGAVPLYVSLLLALCVLAAVLWKYRFYLQDIEERTVLLLLSSLLIILILNALIFRPFEMNKSALFEYLLPSVISIFSILLVFLEKYFPQNIHLYRKIIISCFIIVTLYGFIQKIFGDTKTIIPGITFNYSEAVSLVNEKHPYLWGKNNFKDSLEYIKLSSTYQNGNLFGVNYILFSWFAFFFILGSKKRWNLLLFSLSLIAYSAICLLTASGTVYVGLFLSLFLLFIYFISGVIKNSRNIKRTALKIAGIMAALIVCLSAIYFLIPKISQFLNDRLLQRNFLSDIRGKDFLIYLSYLWNNHLWFQFLFGSFFDLKRTGGAYEITLASIFMNFGLLFTGIFIYTVARLLKGLPFTIYNIGIYTYLVISFLDGGFWLPPTPFIFFSLISLSYYKMRTENSGVYPSSALTK